MEKPNDPARRGEAEECQLGGDIYGLNTFPVRVQFFQRRGIDNRRAKLLAPLCFGEIAI